MPAEFENGMKFLRLGAVFTRYQHKSLKLKIVNVNAVAAISIIRNIRHIRNIAENSRLRGICQALVKLNNLTGRKCGMTKLKLVWPVALTGDLQVVISHPVTCGKFYVC